MSKFCTACGAALTAQAKFCSECGQPTTKQLAQAAQNPSADFWSVMSPLKSTQAVQKPSGPLPVLQVKAIAQGRESKAKKRFLAPFPDVMPVKIFANTIEVVSGKSEMFELVQGELARHTLNNGFMDKGRIIEYYQNKTTFFEQPLIDFFYTSSYYWL